MHEQPSLLDSGLRGSDLTPADVPRLKSDLDRVRAYTLAHGWSTIPEIMGGTGVTMDASVSRYLRYLRQEKHGGYTVEKRNVGAGLWEYRVTAPVKS